MERCAEAVLAQGVPVQPDAIEKTFALGVPHQQHTLQTRKVCGGEGVAVHLRLQGFAHGRLARVGIGLQSGAVKCGVPLGAVGQQALFAQHLQVAADGALGERENPNQLAHGQFLHAQQVEDPQPQGVAHGAE